MPPKRFAEVLVKRSAATASIQELFGDQQGCRLCIDALVHADRFEIASHFLVFEKERVDGYVVECVRLRSHPQVVISRCPKRPAAGQYHFEVPP